MKLLYLILIICFILVPHICCGKLIILNYELNDNKPINLSYIPDDRFKNIDSILLIYYEFINPTSNPIAKEILLKKNQGSTYFDGEILPDSNAIYIILKILGKNKTLITDDNFGNYWDLFLENNGKVQRGAYFLAATSYLGNLPENFRKNVDYRKALNYLELELQSEPDNIQAAIGLNSLMFDLKKLTETQYFENLSKILKILDDKTLLALSEDEFKSVCSAYNILNKRDYIEKLEKKYTLLYPMSIYGEQSLITKIKSSTTLMDFLQYTSQFLRLFPHSSNKEKICFAIVEAFLQTGNYKELITYLDSANIHNPIIFLHIATNIINNKALSSKLNEKERILIAENIIKDYVSAIFENDKFEKNMQHKPVFISSTEWIFQNIKLKGKIAEACGDFFYNVNNFDKALYYYNLSYKISAEESSSDLYYKLIELNIKYGNQINAYNLCSEAIINSEESQEILAKHYELYKSLDKDSFKLDMYPSIIDSLQKTASKKRLNELQYSILSDKRISGAFTTLDGRVYDFNDLSGKIAVILFWSSWCEPCKAIYPVYQELFDKYKNSESINIISINVWEKSEKKFDTLEQFLKKINLGFPVFIDDFGLIPYNAGITGLPTILFIDENSNILFLEPGFNNESQVMKNIEDKIFYLMKK